MGHSFAQVQPAAYLEANQACPLKTSIQIAYFCFYYKPKFHRHTTNIWLSLLLHVHCGLSGDSALCQLHYRIQADGAAPTYQLKELGAGKKKKLSFTFSSPGEISWTCPRWEGTILPCCQEEEENQISVSDPMTRTSIPPTMSLSTSPIGAKGALTTNWGICAVH